MKSHPWLAIAACALPLVAHASRPLTLHDDIHHALLHSRALTGTFGAASDGAPGSRTRHLLSELLVHPEELYSPLIDQPRLTNEIWWPGFVGRFGPGIDQSAVLHGLHRQLGLTKARPGIDVQITADDVRWFRGNEVAASARKAGIDPDIYWKALDLHSKSQITTAAHDAVALQMLRDDMSRAPRKNWAALGIDAAVFDRYMKARNGSELRDDDIRYLTSLVASAVRSRGVIANARGEPQLPAMFRVARTAAAYKDAVGYFSPVPYCVGGEPNPSLPKGHAALDENRPLCFVAATDRDVLRWYRNESRLENSGVDIHRNTHDTWSRVAMLVGIVMPLMDLAAFIESVEAYAAAELAETSNLWAAEAEAASARAGTLMCEVSA